MLPGSSQSLEPIMRASAQPVTIRLLWASRRRIVSSGSPDFVPSGFGSCDLSVPGCRGNFASTSNWKKFPTSPLGGEV